MMYFDKSMGKKKERMNMLKSMRSLMASVVIAAAVLPTFSVAATVDEVQNVISSDTGKARLMELGLLGCVLPSDSSSASGATDDESKARAEKIVNLAPNLATSGETGGESASKFYSDFSGKLFGPEAYGSYPTTLSNNATLSQIVMSTISNVTPSQAAVLSDKMDVATSIVSALDTPEKVDAYTTKTGIQKASNLVATVKDGATKAIALQKVDMTIADIVAANKVAIALNKRNGNATTTTDNRVPSKAALGDALDLLKELTVDLKIEEEDKSDSYTLAQKRIDGQRDALNTQLGKDISSPSALDKSVKELQNRLAKATTGDELKAIAAAILSLQTQTEIWVSNTGILGQVGKDTTQVNVQVNDTLKSINDRVIAGVQNAIRSKPVTCTSTYNHTTHMFVTSCN